MSQSNIVSAVTREGGRHGYLSAVKLFLTVELAAGGLGLVLGGVAGAGFAAMLLFAAVALPVSTWLMVRSLRSSRLFLRERQALLVQRWIDATRDPVEAQRRRELYFKYGLQGTLPFVTDDIARDVRNELAVKANLRQRARKGVLLPDGASGSMPTHAYSGMVSGNGMSLGATGVDVYGDLAGSTANRDFLQGSFNPNTQQWTNADTYTPPT